MSDKLRECPFCGSYSADFEKHDNRCYLRIFSKMMADNSIDDIDKLETAWNTRHEPKHETVEQWEKRTGETYPDDAPVWGFGIDGNYTLMSRAYYRDWNYRLGLVANHHGKPS